MKTNLIGSTDIESRLELYLGLSRRKDRVLLGFTLLKNRVILLYDLNLNSCSARNLIIIFQINHFSSIKGTVKEKWKGV